MAHNIYLYIIVMAVVTYLIRVLPLALIRRKITNKYIRSFLYYVPYATLAAIPAILYSTANIFSAALGFAAALFLSDRGKSLLLVSSCACAAVFAAECIINLFA